MTESFLKNRITTKWWQDKNLTQDQLALLLETAYLSPSKQNCYEWRCVVLTQSDEGKRIKKDIYQNQSWVDSKEVRTGTAIGPRKYNGQYLAPALFLWISRYKEIELNLRFSPERINSSDRDRTLNIEIGLSSGAVMTTAEYLGLSTGFGLCHDSEKLAEILGYSGERAVLALGVGIAEIHSTPTNIANIHLKNVILDGKIIGTDHINLDPKIKTTVPRSRKPLKETITRII